jgi:hypothetical protein
MKEATYSLALVRKIKELFPGCIVLKNDPELLQGFPDLTILYGKRWAVLEVKGDRFAVHQPNQDYYVELCEGMSKGAFIFPENEAAILDELTRHFRPRTRRAVNA